MRRRGRLAAWLALLAALILSGCGLFGRSTNASPAATLARLPTGVPPTVDVVSGRLLRTPDGQYVNLPPGERVLDAVRVRVGWVVTMAVGPSATVWFIRPDRNELQLTGGTQVAVAVHPGGRRAAVAVRGPGPPALDVYALPSGERVAHTPLPADAYLAGWAGDRVLLRTGDQADGPWPLGTWLPGTTPYAPGTATGEFSVLGTRDGATVLAADKQDCLLLLRIADDTVAGRRCGLRIAFAPPGPWAAPDGLTLLAVRSTGGLAFVDVDAALAGRPALRDTGLPAALAPVTVVWEDPGTALIQVRDGTDNFRLVRCRTATLRCEQVLVAPLGTAEPAALVRPVGA